MLRSSEVSAGRACVGRKEGKGGEGGAVGEARPKEGAREKGGGGGGKKGNRGSRPVSGLMVSSGTYGEQGKTRREA